MALFEKLLIGNDVKHKLSVPSNFLGHIKLDDHGGKLLRVIDDHKGRSYEFMLSTQAGRYKKPVFQSKGWLLFVKDKGLRPGDSIFFWKDEEDGLYRIQAFFDFWTR